MANTKGNVLAATLAQEELFAVAYTANGNNGTAAAKAAGYSDKSAYSQATRLLKRPRVAARIAELQQALLEKHALKADDVMRQLGAIIRFDPRKLYREDGSLKDVAELDEDTAAALSGFEITVESTRGAKSKRNKKDADSDDIEYTKKIKWHDKNAAIRNGLLHFGLLKDGGVTVNAGVVVISSEDAKLG